MKYLLSLFFSLCCLVSFSQVIENPVFDSCDVAAFHLEKVEITKDVTKIYCSYSAKANSWANISKDTYLRDTKTKKQYALIKCDGLPLEPEKKVFQSEEKCEITFTFPSVKHGNKIDFIEKPGEQAFNIYGIDINKRYDKRYTESEMERFSNMASFYDSSSDTLKAIQYKKDEMQAAQYVYGIKSEAYLNAFVGLCIMHNSHGNHTEAIKQMELLTKLEEEIHGTSNWLYALQLRTLALFYSNAKMYDRSINTFKESIALYEKLNIAEDQYILALEFISQDYESIGNKAQAIIYQNKAIQARKNLNDSEKYLQELEVMVIGGDSVARIEIVENELKRLPQFVDTTSFAFTNVLKALIAALDIKREYKRAINYCDKSLSILKLNEPDNVLRIAEVLALKCKYQQRSWLSYEAISSGEKAKNILDTLNVKSIKYAELLGDLAWAYGLNYDFEKSIQLQTNAAHIYEDAKDWVSLAEAYNSISHYYHNALDLDKAEVNIKKAIEILDNHGDARKYIEAEVGLTGNTDIDSSYDVALIQNRIDIDKYAFLGTLVQIYQKKGNLLDAIGTERKRGLIIKGAEDNKMYSEHLMILSELFRRSKQYENAKKTIEQCCEIISTIENDNIINLSYPNIELAMVCFESGDTTQAIRYAKEAVSLAKAYNGNNLIVIAQSLLSLLYWKNKEHEKAESVLSYTLDYLISNINNDIVGMTTEQKQRMWSQYECLFLQYRDIIDKLDKREELLSKLYDYVLFSKSLLLDTEILSGRAEKSRLSITWKDIQKKLSYQDIAIEFISTLEEKEGYRTYHALIIDKDCNSPIMITLISETELEKIKNTDSRNIQDIVGELLWKPILDKYSKVENIYFSPDGILHILPIEYYKADKYKTMFDNYSMFRLSSTKEIVNRHNSQEPHNAALYGGLDYSPFTSEPTDKCSTSHYDIMRGIAERGGFEPLFNTFEEVQEINNQLKRKGISSMVYSKVDGTEACFKNLSNKVVNIIHLATHGMYVAPSYLKEKKQKDNFQFLEFLSNENDPVKEDIELTHSFLVMSGGNNYTQHYSTSENDGILTAKEISKMNLLGLDLVVLSACETAKGDVENGGVYGLQRGFKKAGANTIIMSLDKVDDEATKILMVEFYRNLMDGQTKMSSLREAQRYLRNVENGKYSDPKIWASFIMLDGLN